jgi:hypothetical protein
MIDCIIQNLYLFIYKLQVLLWIKTPYKKYTYQGASVKDAVELEFCCQSSILCSHISFWLQH